MDFRLSDDQRAFATLAQELFADFCSDEALRAHDAGSAPFHEALWEQCVAAGLHTMVLPEAAGGLGLGLTELGAVLEQQGRALALVPLAEHQLAAACVAEHGAPSLAARVLPAAASGAGLLTLSLAALTDPHGCALHLSRATAGEGAGWLLSGRVAAVPLAAQAVGAVLPALCEGELRLVYADLRAAGVAIAEGRSQRHEAVAELEFIDLPVGEAVLLAPAALGWLTPRVLAALAAQQLGVSQEQLRRTVEYVSERQQFGRVIGSFQLVAGQMADGYIAVEALRSALAQLLYRIDAGQGAAPQAWSTRALACDCGHRVGHMAQHVHGGIGSDTSFHIHRFLYWSRALGLAAGGAAANLAQLGDWLAHHDTLGWKYDLAEDTSV